MDSVRPHRQVLDLMVIAAVRELLARPALFQYLDLLFKQLNTVRHLDAECPEVGVLVAQADAHRDPPLGDDVQGYDIFCQAHRMMQRQKDHRCSHPQSSGCRGHDCADDQRRGQKTVFILMVLAKETGIKSRLFCQLRLFDNLVNASRQILSPGWVGYGTVYSEFHGLITALTGCFPLVVESITV